MKIIKWGILGTSHISEVMASAIQESQTSQLVAIGSRSIFKAQQFAEKFSIPKIFDHYQDLLNDAEIDVVYIGLPNHLHAEWIMRCAQAQKHILCEKPLVVSIKEAEQVISAVKHANVFCTEALMYCYHPVVEKLKTLIQSNIIGKIKLYHATYTAHIADVANPVAGGSIRNLGCYPISLIRLLANAEPIEICGSGRLNQKNGTDNQASVILRFADHSMAVVSTADDIKMFWQFDVYGERGRLKVITNPWLPGNDNQIMIQLFDGSAPIEINVHAENSLYTYQIDFTSTQIMRRETAGVNPATLLDSLGNTIVLETWLQQVKSMQHLENCA